MNIVIGTAQLGRPYGVANKFGKITNSEFEKILALAQKNNITLLDTGNDYGDSEQRLGMLSNGLDFNFITKLYFYEDSQYNEIENMVKNSIKKLRTKKLFGLLTHKSDDLLSSRADKIMRDFMAAKNSGLTENIGVSAGTPEQIKHIINNHNIDMIQIPANIADQRFYQCGLIDEMKKRGTKIYIRSIFLQGLFFMLENNIHPYFDDFKKYTNNLCRAAKECNVSIFKLAIEYAKSLDVDGIVIGIDDANQLHSIINTYKMPFDVSLDFGQFSMWDERFINPGNWPIGGWNDNKR